MKRRWKIFLVVGIATIVADLGTKYWAEHALPVSPAGLGEPVSVIPNFWDWRLSYNTGSAFGLFHSVTGAQIFLSLIGVVALAAVLYWVRKTPETMTRLLVALGLVAGGAVGNLYDRILYGKVTDFVVWRWHEHQWPTFNVADVALVVGVGLLFLDLGRLEKAGRGAAPADEPGHTEGKGPGKSKARAKARAKN